MKPRLNDLRLLNRPMLIQVRERAGLPAAVQLRGEWRTVTSVRDRWRIHDEWWTRNEIHRAYWQVVLPDGSLTTIFQDLLSAAWYRQHARPVEPARPVEVIMPERVVGERERFDGNAVYAAEAT